MTLSSPLNPPFFSAKDARLFFGNLSGASAGLMLSTLSQKFPRPYVVITPNTLLAERLHYELTFFATQGSATPIISFPDWETLPYDHFSPHQEIISERLAALQQIPNLKSGIILLSITTLMHRLSPKTYIDGNIFLLKPQDTVNINATRQRLEKAGYRAVNEVREPGEFAVRGSIIDIFPTGSTDPFRLDLLDDEIDSIRIFSAETQRSLAAVDEIALLPAKEYPFDEPARELFRQHWRSQFSGNPLNAMIYQDVSEGIAPPGIEYYLPLFFEKTATLFDYLPPESVILTFENSYEKAEEFWREIQQRYEQRQHDTTRPLLKPEHIYQPVRDVFHAIKNFAEIKISTQALATHANVFNFETLPPQEVNIDYKHAEPLHTLKDFVAHYSGRILICAESAGRREVLLPLLHKIDLYPKNFATWHEFLTADVPYGITIGALDHGLQLKNPPLALISETELFGKKIMQRRRRKETPQDVEYIVKDLTELQFGSPIVHADHGVGRYQGLQTLQVGEQLAEFLQIEYADGDKLYVPVSSLHLISRYSGQDPDNAPLHKLGTSYWSRAKKKAAEQVSDVAAELLELYAQRAAQTGFAYQELNGQYEAFAASFPFEETADQLQAIDAIISDMASDKPMDRLICGDVGFGKTEVAMRAAFIAVQNNKQVAVLVPTTLLAQQHWQTFQDRFADWPIRIEMLSRFKTTKEQNKILTQLQQGSIDIVIGTHKLLQNNIQFKSLGLLIIDEEHRFGVKQKERLKALRFNVDILALTATPIPRTLNMAFAGIRDLSMIATPPKERLAIKTFVHEYQAAIVQEALMREILRGGQVYYLYNDVASIEKAAREIEKLMPEARVGIAHGQMHERELEQIMADFYHRRFNILVCTTIIESGIDIPSANTIIIHRADKLGLAQLHQLRGRVGRSHHQAYAYLLTLPRKLLSSDAEKRLDAIAAYEDLGIGFTLATHDLEIRGAGELLGKNQSGNMHEIGFTLYMDLLTRAVQALKSGKNPNAMLATDQRVEIELQIPALIPENYLGDVELRLQFYKRIAQSKTSVALDDIQIEMIDRFGLFPPPLKNLIALQLLKLTVAPLGIIKIDANSKGGKIEFSDKPTIDPMRIIHLIQKESQQFRLDGPTRLRFSLPPHDLTARLSLVETIIQKLI